MPRKASVRKPRKKQPEKGKVDIVLMRSLAHDLSNALEAILQASYLLSQAKLNEDAKRWVQLIDVSSQEAARINRELRKFLRELSGD
jgi:nitrogen-specific signal transduction histidine kinase